MTVFTMFETQENIINGALIYLRRIPQGDVALVDENASPADYTVAAMNDNFDAVYAECVQAHDWQEFLVWEDAELAPEGELDPDYYRQKVLIIRPANTIEVRRVTHPFALSLENREGSLSFTEYDNRILADISVFAGRDPAQSYTIGTTGQPPGLQGVIDGLGGNQPPNPAAARLPTYKVWRVRIPAIERVSNANFRNYLKASLALRVIAPTAVNDTDFYKRLTGVAQTAFAQAIEFDKRFSRNTPYYDSERQYDYNAPHRRYFFGDRYGSVGG